MTYFYPSDLEFQISSSRVSSFNAKPITPNLTLTLYTNTDPNPNPNPSTASRCFCLAKNHWFNVRQGRPSPLGHPTQDPLQCLTPPTSNPSHVKLSQVLHSAWMTDDDIRTHGRPQKRSPSAVRVEPPRPKTNLVHFYPHKTLLHGGTMTAPLWSLKSCPPPLRIVIRFERSRQWT